LSNQLPPPRPGPGPSPVPPNDPAAAPPASASARRLALPPVPIHPLEIASGPSRLGSASASASQEPLLLGHPSLSREAKAGRSLPCPDLIVVPTVLISISGRISNLVITTSCGPSRPSTIARSPACPARCRSRSCRYPASTHNETQVQAYQKSQRQGNGSCFCFWLRSEWICD
jgi:hypothetical protein